MKATIIYIPYPKHCLECELKVFDSNVMEYYCPYTNVVCLSIGKQADCPLHEAEVIIENWSKE